MPSFYAKITDERLHRIVIDRDVWDELGLQKGDWIKVTVERAQPNEKKK
jgi:hypothetical protein